MDYFAEHNVNQFVPGKQILVWFAISQAENHFATSLMTVYLCPIKRFGRDIWSADISAAVPATVR